MDIIILFILACCVVVPLGRYLWFLGDLAIEKKREKNEQSKKE